MTTTQIYRGTENETIPQITRDETLEEVIKHLKRFDFADSLSREKQLELLEYTPILNQSQILSLSRHMKKLEERIDKQNYLRLLIQKSFDRGNNDFIIDNWKNSLGNYKLTGRLNKKLKITYLNESSNIVSNCTNCHIIAKENINFSGWNNNICYVEIEKNIDALVLNQAYDCTYKILGKLGDITIIHQYGGETRYCGIKLILNSEEYAKYKENSKINLYERIKLEMIQ